MLKRLLVAAPGAALATGALFLLMRMLTAISRERWHHARDEERTWSLSS